MWRVLAESTQRRLLVADQGSGRVLLDRQIHLIETGDLDALVEQYDDDEAVLLRFDRVARGKQEIRDLLGAYLERSPQLLTLDAYAEPDDCLSYQATMSIAEQTVRTYGAFVLRGGRIRRQFAGLITS